MNAPAIGIIIPNWNRCADTLECLDSLRLSAYPHSQTGIFVSDNGSTDGSLSAIRERFDDMRTQKWRELVLIENGRNAGFAGAVNAAYVRMGPDYEFIFLTNNDVAFRPNTLQWLLDAMQPDDSIGIAGAKVLSYRHPETLAHGAGYIRPFLCGTRSVDAPEACVCDFVTGCALCVRRAVIERLGGLLDEEYFAYWEDTDLCARAREAGFRVAYCPDAEILHKISASTSSGSTRLTAPSKAYLETFGKMRYARKHLPLWERAVFHALFAIRIPCFIARAFICAPRQASPAVRAYLKAVIDGWRGGAGGPYAE